MGIHKNNLNKMAKSKGLGDTIEKITTATGIKKAVEKVAGKGGCGCNKRKKALNKIFPYKNQSTGKSVPKNKKTGPKIIRKT